MRSVAKDPSTSLRSAQDDNKSLSGGGVQRNIDSVVKTLCVKPSNYINEEKTTIFGHALEADKRYFLNIRLTTVLSCPYLIKNTSTLV